MNDDMKNLYEFIRLYESLSPEKRRGVDRMIFRATLWSFAKGTVSLREVLEGFCHLMWPSLRPFVLPALAVLLLLGLYLAIGAKVNYSADGVELSALLGCLAGAAAGYYLPKGKNI